MKLLLLTFNLLISNIFSPLFSVKPVESPVSMAPGAVHSHFTSVKPASPADTNLTIFGRGIYPGEDSTFKNLRGSGFNTIVLSSFYIRANGDVYSGDDSKNPIIHEGKYVGNTEWLKRVASLKQQPTSITRIEILLEGRWINQPPNTYDFIQDWSDDTKVIPAISTGTGSKSTLYQIGKILKKERRI